MPRYSAFGKKLAAYRLAAGIQHQAQMAERVRSTQQTVSRWESGESRPRQGQIPALAAALNVDAEELSRLAGYGVSPVVATFDQPFPVDALGPESFEQFCFFFLKALYQGARVNRFGAQGHEQDGIDIEAVLIDGTRIDFQCKRAEEFGPAKVREAVSEYKRDASRKVILLSRVASPKARNSVAEFNSWSIMDKEDISREIRQLAKTEQVRLVDTFFRGQRLALLGETEPSVWQTSSQFYAPFMRSGGFTHDWNLVGREAESAKLAAALSSKSVSLVLLTAVAGGGKSRVLKQAIEDFEENAGSALLTRFLSPTEVVTNKSLDDLGVGAKLLVVDDAHDRQDLDGLFQFVANPSNNAKLLLAVRPYGLDLLKQQAASFNLFDTNVVEITLSRLSLEQATKLAAQVLLDQMADPTAAEHIAKLTLDCPLATVMGAWVVAKEKKYFEFAANEANFRNLLMSKFRDIIIGNISSRDADAIRKLLAVVALIQPFNVENPHFVQICAEAEKLSDVDVPRLFRVLVDAGVLFRRGDYYRIAPDLLADFIIEKECIVPDGGSTGYAERVFEAVETIQKRSGRDDHFIKQIVLSLGKLDWRRSNGDPVNSTLLDRIWSKLCPTQKYNDPHLEAVKTVAYYQPSRALGFAEDLLRKGTYLDEVPGILKSVSYSAAYLKQACEGLWELGKTDVRETGPHPEHPIRLLADLASVESGKPLRFNEIVADFAISLFDDPSNWKGTYSPLDILEGAIRTEGDTVAFKGPNMSLSPYHVRPDFVRALRIKIRDAAIRLLSNSDVSIAIRAAAFFRNMLSYPMGILNSVISDDVYALWTAEFVDTLNELRAVSQKGHLNRLVLFELARSVSWHAHHSKFATQKVARAIIRARPKDIDFRFVVALVDPYGQTFEKSRVAPDSDWSKGIKSLADELAMAYPDGNALRMTIEGHLKDVRKARMRGDSYTLVRELMQRSEGLSRSVVDHALRDPNSPSADFAAAGLDALLQKDRVAALALSEDMVATGNVRLACAAAVSHGWFDFTNDVEGRHRALMSKLFASADINIVSATLRAVEQIAKSDRPAALKLVLDLNLSLFLQSGDEAQIAAAERLVDEVFNLFHDGRGIPFVTLSEDDVGALLGKLRNIRSLDGYWIQTFLARASQTFAPRCLEFLQARVEIVAATSDWRYRPCNAGYQHVPFQFRSAADFPLVLGSTFQWIKSHPDRRFEHYAGSVFSAMALPFDQDIVNLFDGWLSNADARDVEVMGRLVCNADHSFVFSYPQFVSRFLNTARRFGPDALNDAIGSLYTTSMFGMRSGVPGQPFKRDLNSNREAENRMKEVSRFSPEYELYRMIRDGSEREIKMSAKQAEHFED